ncbi:hypothetical protein [Leuconostoc carnosum]|nr:hypothetical protein [Leuconostoc carnosum]MBB6432173.1 hypothetical protein [Leuconostoc carnosum]
MSALTGPILCFLVLGVLYFIDYFLPTWLGTVPGNAPILVFGT